MKEIVVDLSHIGLGKQVDAVVQDIHPESIYKDYTIEFQQEGESRLLEISKSQIRKNATTNQAKTETSSSEV